MLILFGAVFCAVALENQAHHTAHANVSPVRVSLVGDSLVKQNQDTYVKALKRAGFKPSVDGVGSRAVRSGWQCRIGGYLRIYDTKVHEGCKPEGIERIRLWREAGELGDRLVVALGTNDAALYPPNEVFGRFKQLRRVAGDLPVHLVTAAKLTGPGSRAKVAAWNKEARRWCESDRNCQMIEWGDSKWAKDHSSYTGDKVHLSLRGLERRASFIAKTLSEQVPSGQ